MEPAEQFLGEFFEERERKARDTYGDLYGSGLATNNNHAFPSRSDS